MVNLNVKILRNANQESKTQITIDHKIIHTHNILNALYTMLLFAIIINLSSLFQVFIVDLVDCYQ